MEVKKLNEYDMKRVISRAKKEYGSIAIGAENNYNPQLNNLEHFIYKVYTKFPINDNELEQVIEMIIYDLKAIIDNKDYDYSAIRDKKLIEFCKALEKYFNPFINDSIKLTTPAYDDLKCLFTLPIKCLLRIYDSISFWRNKYGINGYFRMLEEYVLPVFEIGDYPYILEYKYIDDIIVNDYHNDEIDEIVDNLYKRIDMSCPLPTKEDITDFITIINYLLDICHEYKITTSDDLDECGVIKVFSEDLFEDFNMCIANLNNNIYDEKKIIEILDNIMNILKLNPITYENVLRSKILLMFRLKEYDKAEKIMKKYIDKHPENVYAYVELIDDFLMIDNIEKAKYYYELGVKHKNMKDYDALEERYEEIYKEK